LEGNLDAILGDMEKDTRNRIARSSRYGLEFSDSPKEMAELTCLSFERKNQRPSFSREAYQKYLNGFSHTKAIKTIIAKDKDDLLAGGTIAYDSNSAYYLLGGFNPQGNYKGVGQLVMWMLIKHAKEVLGLREFDFLIPQNENAERFYRGFGGKLTHSYVIYKNNIALRFIDTARKMKSKLRTR
jgi:lipid II:glycine glycyltransferase (peptidoglycan interpeptide bridge formation enzyme)